MNKYEVLGVVGEGAYGVVLKCRNKESGDVCAIKKFKESDDGNDEGLLKTTQREVKILRLLKHNNIVSLIEAFKRKSKLYLVFEYVDKNLLEVLEEQSNGLDANLARSYTHQLIQAIHWCHSNNVIHRDIKPENLLINPRTKVLKLCDFGFARTLSQPCQNLTDYVATRWYRAPELLLGSTNYSFGVDIWAIACILGEITDGQPLFAGESEIDQLYIIQKILGPLTSEHLDMFVSNSRFAGLKFADMSTPETLQKKYAGKMTKKTISFMNMMLAMEPRDRPSALECLNHTYFEGMDGRRSGGGQSSNSNRICAAANTSAAIKQSQQHDQPSTLPSVDRSKPILNEQLRQQATQDAKYMNDSLSIAMTNTTANIESNIPPSRQKSKEQQARDREREIEREREAQREKEIRSFREFSTQLPFKQQQHQHSPTRRTVLHDQLSQHQYQPQPQLQAMSSYDIYSPPTTTNGVHLGPLELTPGQPLIASELRPLASSGMSAINDITSSQYLILNAKAHGINQRNPTNNSSSIPYYPLVGPSGGGTLYQPSHAVNQSYLQPRNSNDLPHIMALPNIQPSSSSADVYHNNIYSNAYLGSNQTNNELYRQDTKQRIVNNILSPAIVMPNPTSMVKTGSAGRDEANISTSGKYGHKSESRTDSREKQLKQGTSQNKQSRLVAGAVSGIGSKQR